MKNLMTLLFAVMLFSFQAVYSEGQSQQPRPPQPMFPPAGQAQSFAGNAFGVMEDAFAKQDDSYTMEDEYALGRVIAASILGKYKPYTANQDLTNYVNRICQTIVINSPQPAIFNGYHVLILDSPEFNAFASPGGHLFITRGLVEACSSEDILAAVIAHELAHVMLKHGIAIANSFEAQMNVHAADAARQGQALAQSSAANRLMSYRQQVSGLLDTLTVSGYAQEQEFEADREAAVLLATAGYDPNAIVEMLRILQRVQSSQMGGFNTTHPTPAARISNVEGLMWNIRVNDTKSFRVPRFKNK